MQDLKSRAEEYVRGVVTDVLGTLPLDAPGDDPLSAAPTDSITKMNLVLRLEEDFGELPVTLLYEYQTVEQVASYLLEEHAQRLSELCDTGGTWNASSASAVPGSETDVPPPQAESGDKTALSDGIAIVGVSGRYPGAADMDSFWDDLRAGVCRISEIPRQRWTVADDATPGERWAALLDDVDSFDAAFFNILPHDAENMDPQERLFLETAWNLLEDSGFLGTSTHEPSTGVFVGTMHTTYGKIGATRWADGPLVGPESSPGLIANRVSYFFDFSGPSFAVDSACSASLTAVHLACESLRRGECRMAIAGGVNLILHRSHLAGLAAMGVLAPDGRDKVFDARANGFVPGEGVGAVLLRPLRDAVANGDRILGVIRASFVNSSGRTSGFMVPSPRSQADLVSETLIRAGVDPSTVNYIEAHGTGTALGDPIELDGLSRVFSTADRDPDSCAVGSLKANIGHLEGAAGIAGLTKVLLQLRHRELAPCAGLESVNPKITLAGTPFHFPRSAIPWAPVVPRGPGSPLPRRAGVSAFGAGGANAHVVVEEFLPKPSQATGLGGSPGRPILLLSARTPTQLRLMAKRTADMLARDTTTDLDALAFTSQVGRRELPARLAVLTEDIAEAVAALRAFHAGGEHQALLTIRPHASIDRQLLDGEEGREFVRMLMRRRSLEKLARLWVDGIGVDWSLLWPGSRPTRISLPSQPWERTSYWVHPHDEMSGRTTESMPLASDSPSDAAPPEAVGGDIGHQLRLVASTYLRTLPHEVDLDADLMEIGFDSIALIDLIRDIDERFGIKMDPDIVLDGPSLRSIKNHLLTYHPNAISQEDT
ncbi:beta-ketoacyl synthase N-terminal-like domain-containing protein [Nocardiopsis sp. YSL2]|uniref:beta-ketoacyl synthase N-terminal-like domain-containing protein n=1 Tax=Nocardiopsis sp. YSL2 TaxID=2939492 RepID=UPI0026F414CC|nr:beta-ketoacyl synthase N-terminal-like domain-containing protein [Nocardiopsis sp. YSL2]